MAAAVFGFKFEHTNYVVYLVSRIWFKSPAHPLSNAPGFKRIRQEMRKCNGYRFRLHPSRSRDGCSSRNKVATADLIPYVLNIHIYKVDIFLRYKGLVYL